MLNIQEDVLLPGVSLIITIVRLVHCFRIPPSLETEPGFEAGRIEKK